MWVMSRLLPSPRPQPQGALLAATMKACDEKKTDLFLISIRNFRIDWTRLAEPDPSAARTLEAIAGAGSLIAAAADLHMTPAALTARLKGLETAVGMPLFDRTSLGLRLNPAGEIARRSSPRGSSGRCANFSEAMQAVSHRARAGGCRSGSFRPPNISRPA